MKKISLLLCILIPAFAVSAQDLTILHLNDTHSNVEPIRGGTFKGLGGAIEHAAYVDSVRAVDGKGNVLLLHAGDFSQGTSYFMEFKGDLDVDIINAMKYDAVALGNHEFDNGFDELARRLKNLDVPALCANYDFTGTPLEGLVEPYCIVTKARKKIGIIGLLADLNGVTDQSIYNAVKYKNPIDVTNELSDKLKNTLGCDLVICLTHLGFKDEPMIDPDLAKATRNVDIIVGGHSHTFLDDLVKVKNLDGKDVVIVTTGKWGVNVGNLKVTYQENKLTNLYNQLKDQNVFSAGSDWFPYPAYSDRKAWEELLGDYAQFFISNGEKYLNFKWENVPATSYLEFERTGGRDQMQTPMKNNRLALNALLFAELAEGKGRFVDQLINGSWYMSHMPSWVLSAHLPRQRSKRALPDPLEQIIDLGSGATGAQLAVVYHFFKDTFDAVDPVISRVIKDAIDKQILTPYLNPDEQRPNWWLVYDITSQNVINNWNPWCNADVMLCFFLVEDNQERLERAVFQSVKSVDCFLGYIKKDGACEEGPAYWGHAAGKLYDYLQIMYDASKGRFSIFDDEQVKLMGEYISRSFVHDGWVVNFADASARLSYAPSVIYNYGKAVGSAEMMDFALYNLADKNASVFKAPKPVMGNDAYRSIESIKTISEMSEKVASLNASLKDGKSMDKCLSELRKAVPAFTWYPETEFCYIQNKNNWFFAAKGGYNNESHNHNDIGTFLLYVDGVPMFVDAGVGTYTKKTFSKDRYTIWSMCSDWHNLPMINGMTQEYGGEYRSAATKALNNRSAKRFSLDIVGAYPENSGCKSWVRDYQLKDNSLTITDTFVLGERKGADVENFMFQGKVYLPGEDAEGYVVKKGEAVVINSGVKMRIKYSDALVPSVTVMELDDKRFTDVWGEKLYRLSLTSEADAPLNGKYTFVIDRLK